MNTITNTMHDNNSILIASLTEDKEALMYTVKSLVKDSKEAYTKLDNVLKQIEAYKEYVTELEGTISKTKNELSEVSARLETKEKEHEVLKQELVKARNAQPKKMMPKQAKNFISAIVKEVREPITCSKCGEQFVQTEASFLKGDHICNKCYAAYARNYRNRLIQRIANGEKIVKTCTACGVEFTLEKVNGVYKSRCITCARKYMNNHAKNPTLKTA